jgi:glycosyltransferase involved in cell wall biosynthesis
MRVLGVTFLLPHSKAHSGAGLVMHGQYAALGARHDLTLVTFAVTEPEEKAALARLRQSGIKVHVVGETMPAWAIRLKRRWQRRVAGWVRPESSLGDLGFVDLRMQNLLDRLLSQGSFDLLQVESVGFGNYQYRTQIPSVLIEHQAASSEPGQDGDQSRVPTWQQFDRIQVFTQRDASAIRRLAPELADRVRVNPFGVDLVAEADHNREESNLITFVGGFHHAPNVDAALWLGLEIMPILRKIGANAFLEIVGNDPPAAVRALASSDIKVTGRVPDIMPYLERAAVVLAPVRLGGGMRVKVLQAMAMGKAVVTTPLGAEGLATVAGPPAAGDRRERPRDRRGNKSLVNRGRC